jgi:hypothetical protein
VLLFISLIHILKEQSSEEFLLETCSQMLRVKNKATEKVLNVKVLRPSKHYLPSDIMNSGRRL